MECPTCHEENRPTARFCHACGTTLLEPALPGIPAPTAPPPPEESLSQAGVTPPLPLSSAPIPVPTLEVEGLASGAGSPPLATEPDGGSAVPTALPSPTSTPPLTDEGAATLPVEETTPPLVGEQGSSPPTEESLSPLPLGSLVAGRFEIVAQVEGGESTNLYSAQDLVACPKCGFIGNQEGDDFCSECGVELRAVGPPFLVTLREAISPQSIGAAPEAGLFHNERFYLVLTETAPLAGVAGAGLTFAVGYASHAGVVRELDEDSLCVFTLAGLYESVANPVMGLYILADGMGGHEGGEIASKMVVRLIAERLLKRIVLPGFVKDTLPNPETIRARLREAILYANEQLYRLARERSSDMGCTLTMALVANQQVYIANVGDSRTYLRDTEALKQLTTDHSVVASLIATGMATPDEIYSHPDRHVIYRSIGNKPTLEIDVWERTLSPGNTLLLCCDGLWETLHDEGLDEVLLSYFEPQAACDELIRRANQAGASDNVSVIVVKAVSANPSPER